MTLLWSVFLFSGYVDSEFLTLPTDSKIELVAFQTANSSAAVFQQSTARLALSKQFFSLGFYSKTALITYNRLQQVQFIAWKKKGYAFPLSFVYLPIKVIPSNSKEISLTPLLS